MGSIESSKILLSQRAYNGGTCNTIDLIDSTKLVNQNSNFGNGI
jgi:hypothetical protein